MAHISGHDRSQTLLFPESVDDYVGPDNPVRFIDAFVDRLDLAAAGFAGVAPKATGRPGYAPADLLKLYIYGYLNRIRSSRRLEAETHRNVEVIWLLRHLKPDFKTIADFRRDNRAAFKPIFREFVLLCRQLDLFGRELLAVDGTRLSPKYQGKSRELTKIDYSNRAACLTCAPRPRCTKSFRRVSRPENEAVLDRMAARLKARPDILDRRRDTVEHPFGSIKQWMGQGAFPMMGLENVRAEFSLTALAYNLRRVINLLGSRAMIAAVQG